MYSIILCVILRNDFVNLSGKLLGSFLLSFFYFSCNPLIKVMQCVALENVRCNDLVAWFVV